MADIAFEHYATRNPYFFTLPDELEAHPQLFPLELPMGWNHVVEHEWTHAIPSVPDIPSQGWKIHVSAIPVQAAEVLDAASGIFFDADVTFKYLSTPQRLSARNSKITPRGHAGKFITAYPTERQLHSTLEELENALLAFSGPYILSDKRWRSAPVYLRFGGFRPLSIAGTDGTKVPAIRDDKGGLVPDERNGSFSHPAWAPVPEFLKSWLDGRDPDADAIMPFQLTSAVKFSSAGGTYRGTTLDGGDALIVKEARAHIAHDYMGRNAIDRLEHETVVLRALEGIRGVPSVFWDGMLWENRFAALEHCPGIPLRSWVVANFPAYSMSPAAATSYLKSILKIGLDLERILNEIHSRGWTHFDVHGDNILISETLGVSLIDFECALPVSDAPVEQIIAASGFRAIGKRTASKSDWHGLRQTVAFMLVPLIRQAELVPDYSHQTRSLAAAIFPDDPDVVQALTDVLSLLLDLDGRSEDAEARAYLAKDRWALRATLVPFVDDQSILTAIRSGYRSLQTKWKSKERLFPVHVYGLEKESTGLTYGDAGVVAALLAVDDDLDVGKVGAEWPGIVDRLAEQSMRGANTGLFSGAMGDLWALAMFDEKPIVQKVLDSRLDVWLDQEGARIHDGLPGILLGSLRLWEAGFLAERQLASVMQKLDGLVARYQRDPGSVAPIGKARTNRGNMPDLLDSGLLYGHLGIAWLSAEANRILDTRSFLDTANLAMEYELSGYQFDEGSGTLQLSEGSRTLPYLATGSAGFGIVLEHLNPSDVEPSIVESCPFLLRATQPPFTVFPGLLAGYAGLALGGAGIARFLGLPIEKRSNVVRKLSAYSLETDDGVVFAGDSGIRITADFASGGAGIAFALIQLRAGRFDLLPPLGLSKRPAP
jgi:hypothetical protein